jgi:riboflavin kinase/FMN adenylyltransferase
MEIIEGIEHIRKRHRGGVLTLGTFDGVHLGHRRLFLSLRRRAKRLKAKSIVLTFDNHPLRALTPRKCPPLLSSPEEKVRLIRSLKVDILILANFNRGFSSLSPEEFIKDVLIDKLAIKEICVGRDFVFGCGATGNTASLRTMAKEYGFKVRISLPVRIGKTVISSTVIRQLIKEGEVKKAAKLLGRPYSLCGRVIHGRACGREWGYPTANLKPYYGELIPPDGVYLVTITIKTSLHRYPKCWDGLVNIGIPPAFGKDENRQGYDKRRPATRRRKRVIEAHIFGFDQEVYGQDIKINFLRKMREEMNFKDPEALGEQIQNDIARARKILSIA